jgi:integrase
MGYLKKQVTTHWVDATGKRVPKRTPKAKKEQTKSPKWYGFFNSKGKKLAFPLHRDKRVAEKMLKDLEAKHYKNDLGNISPLAKHLDRPISDHLEMYTLFLKEKDRGVRYLKDCKRLITTTLIHFKLLKTEDNTWQSKITSCKTLQDLISIDVEDFDLYLAKMKFSGRTKNTYRGAISSFLTWLVSKRRLETNPFLLVTKSDESRKTFVRRSESETNIIKLLQSAKDRPLAKFKERCMEGKASLDGKIIKEAKKHLDSIGYGRALLYKTAVLTGLRATELHKLKVHFLETGTDQPKLFAPKAITKNKKDAVFHLRKEFAEELDSWVKQTSRKPTDPLFSVPRNYLRNFKKDLLFAGIPFLDTQGRKFDFHALRKTCNVLMGQAKISPALRQKHMRHSDIRLTLETYDDADAYDQTIIVSGLPEFKLNGGEDAKL